MNSLGDPQRHSYVVFGQSVAGYVLYHRSRAGLQQTPLLESATPLSVGEVCSIFGGENVRYFLQSVFNKAKFVQLDEEVPFGHYYIREHSSPYSMADCGVVESKKTAENHDGHSLLDFYLLNFSVSFFCEKDEEIPSRKNMSVWVIDVKHGMIWGFPPELPLSTIQDQIGRTDVAIGDPQDQIPIGVYFVQEPRVIFSPSNRSTTHDWMHQRLPVQYNELYSDTMTPMLANKNKVVVDGTNIYSYSEGQRWTECLKHSSATGSDMKDLNQPEAENVEGEPKNRGLFRLQRHKKAYTLESTGDVVYVEQAWSQNLSSFIPLQPPPVLYPNPSIDEREFTEHYNKKRNNVMHLCFPTPVSQFNLLQVNILLPRIKMLCHFRVELRQRRSDMLFKIRRREQLCARVKKKGEDVFDKRIETADEVEKGRVEIHVGTQTVHESVEKICYITKQQLSESIRTKETLPDWIRSLYKHLDK